jgi:hypothetical protein
MNKRADKGRLAGELAGLPKLGRATLMEKWRACYGNEPPTRIREEFLIHAIAHRLQEQALGGLAAATQRFLTRAAQEHTQGQKTSSPPVVLKPGTRLLREWHGVTYEVIVLEKSVQCNGKSYRSLTELAHHITGVKWSGPAFFGLKKKGAS